MRFRSNEKKKINPYVLSSLLHVGIFGIGLAGANLKSGVTLETVQIEVYEKPKVVPSTKKFLPPRPPRIDPPEEEPTPVPEASGRKVFGISQRTLTQEEGIEVKAGNTLAKAPDNLELEPGDADSLPIPTEEYLVTQMPVLRSEIRIPYPPEARKKGIEGPVVIDLLIDTEGKVRETKLIDGPGGGLNEAAMEAVQNLKFSPARVEEQAVAVRIRYIYRFVLES